jgi:hypothetical protein
MKSTTLALVGLAAALAACSKAGDGGTGGGSSRLCTPFPEQASTANGQPAPAPTDPAGVLDDCLHRWGYSLAASSDRAEEVAQAVTAACTSALSRWNQQGLTSGGAPQTSSGDAVTAPSLVTGQLSNPIAEHYNFAQGRALFYVVQARAGKCSAPPAARTNAQNR